MTTVTHRVGAWECGSLAVWQCAPDRPNLAQTLRPSSIPANFATLVFFDALGPEKRNRHAFRPHGAFLRNRRMVSVYAPVPRCWKEVATSRYVPSRPGANTSREFRSFAA